MTAEQAIAVTETQRPALAIDPEMRVSSAEQAIVWTAAGDKIAWIVTLTSRCRFCARASGGCYWASPAKSGGTA